MNLTAEQIQSLIKGKSFVPDRRNDLTYYFDESNLTIKNNEGLSNVELHYSVVKKNGRHYLHTEPSLTSYPLIIGVLNQYSPIMIQLINAASISIYMMLLEKTEFN